MLQCAQLNDGLRCCRLPIQVFLSIGAFFFPFPLNTHLRAIFFFFSENSEIFLKLSFIKILKLFSTISLGSFSDKWSWELVVQLETFLKIKGCSISTTLFDNFQKTRQWHVDKKDKLVARILKGESS